MTVLEKKEEIIQNYLFHELLNKDDKEDLHHVADRIKEYSDAFLSVFFALEHAEYDDVDINDFRLIANLHNQLTISQILVRDQDLNWFNKKMPKIIKNWK